MNDYELYHFGIKGMKWGVRRYQNKDGSLTPTGKKRYNAKVKQAKDWYGKERWQDEIDSNKKEVSSIKKAGYKKWAKDNYLDVLDDSDQKSMFNEQIKWHENRIKDAQKTLNRTGILYERLDSIDPTSVGYKRAMKLVNQVVREWVDEDLK